MSVLTDIVTGVFTPIKDLIVRRAEIKHEELQTDLANKKALQDAQIEAVREGRNLDSLWELESLRNSGWKDEFWTILFAIPAFGVFIPSLQEPIKRGFIILESSTPEWYRWTLMVIVMASFGVRLWRRI